MDLERPSEHGGKPVHAIVPVHLMHHVLYTLLNPLPFVEPVRSSRGGKGARHLVDKDLFNRGEVGHEDAGENGSHTRIIGIHEPLTRYTAFGGYTLGAEGDEVVACRAEDVYCFSPLSRTGEE